jgi:hypothetical protein
VHYSPYVAQCLPIPRRSIQFTWTYNRVVGKVPRRGDSAKSLVRHTDNSSSEEIPEDVDYVEVNKYQSNCGELS